EPLPPPPAGSNSSMELTAFPAAFFPAIKATCPLGRSTAAWPTRAVAIGVRDPAQFVPVQENVPALKSSAKSVPLPPDDVSPPAMKTLPSVSRVAVAPTCGLFREPAVAAVLLPAMLMISALVRVASLHPRFPQPPATSSVPSARIVL